MASVSGRGFIFVNASGASPGDRKASTLARAFVTRNARIAQPCSSRCSEPINSDEVLISTLLASNAESSSAGQKRSLTGKGRSALHEIPDIEVILQDEVSIARPRQLLGPRCSACACWKNYQDGPGPSSFVCQGCRAALVQPSTPVQGRLDPFSCMAIELDERSNTLLNYCKSHPTGSEAAVLSPLLVQR